MKTRSFLKLSVNCLTALLVSATCVPVTAQEVLEEVVVTAMKREQNLQDVSASITALTAQQIREMGITKAQDIGWATPGLYATGSQGDVNPLYTIRGIGLNDVFSNNNPTVGIYVDEVIMPFTPMMGFQLFDMQRIEVLKGPQGTLYGRNSTGGAINFISRKPGDELNGYLNLGYGEFQSFTAEAAVGGPISDTLGGRVAFMTLQRNDGWMKNTVTGKKVGERDQFAVRGMLEWHPSDTFEVRFTGTYGRERSDSALREHVGFLDANNPSNLCAAALAGYRDEGPCVSSLGYFDPTPDRYTVQNSSILGQNNDSDFYGANLTINVSLGDLTLTSVTGYSDFERINSEDSDGTPLVMLDSAFSDDIKAFSQELRLSNSSPSGVDWVLGGFFSDDQIDGDILQALDQHFFLTRVDTNWTQKSTSAAVFGHIDIPFTEQLALVGGVRYTHEKKDFRYDAYDTNPFGTSQFLPTPVAGVVDSISNNQFSGQIGLNFNVTDDVLTYVSYNRGFKSGGYKGAIAFSLPELEPFKEEILDAYEIGIKSTLANGTVRFNAAAYYYDWQDFQAFVTEVRSGINVIVLDNAGDAEVTGVEAEMLWHPVDGLDLQAGVNLMDTEIKKYNTIPGTADAKGNRLANSPKVMFNGRVRYEFPLGSSGLRAYILSDVVYRSKLYYSLSNNGQNSQDGFWLWDGRIAVMSRDGDWEASVWVKNLTDEFYITQSYDNTGGIFPSQNFLGEPRTFGVNVQYNF